MILRSIFTLGVLTLVIAYIVTGPAAATVPRSSGSENVTADYSSTTVLAALNGISRVSVASGGGEANQQSGSPAISADGRYVAFESIASNLVPSDTNNKWDVFVHDQQTGITTRVSIASDGQEAEWHSHHPSISGDGRFIAFGSAARNLVPGDTNTCPNYTVPGSCPDVFVHDRVAGTTARVSSASDSTQGNNTSMGPSISADGRYVAFYSWASNLVAGDTNNAPDLFIHDRQTGETSLISIAPAGERIDDHLSNFSLSGDGRFLVFTYLGDNFVPDDTNNRADVFVHDRQTGETTRVSVDSDGKEGNGHSGPGSISADGRFVAYGSSADNLVSGDTNNSDDIFIHDRQTGETTLVSVASDGTKGDYWSGNPSISADGRFVAFQSYASNLIPCDLNGHADDLFVHDQQTGETKILAVAYDGMRVYDSDVYLSPVISGNGRFVAFASTDWDLVPGDTNGVPGNDIFVSDWQQYEPVVHAPETVAISGPRTASAGKWVDFRAFVEPAGTSFPLKVSWEVSNQPEVVETHCYDFPVVDHWQSFLWTASGEQDVMVTVENAAGSATDTFTMNITDGPTASGDLTILLEANPEDDTRFSFQGNNGLGGFVLRDSYPDHNEWNLENLSPGTYEITETVPAGWALFRVSCSGHHTPIPNGIRISISDGDNLVCTFTNRHNAMATGATDLVFGKDRVVKSEGPVAASADGRYLAFQSVWPLVPDDTNGSVDTYVYDRETGETSRVSVASDGSQGTHSGSQNSFAVSISDDGRFVAFDSQFANLVRDDTNQVQDIFVHDRHTGMTERVSVASDGREGNASSFYASISGDGRFVAFVAAASLVGETGGVSVFVHDRETRETTQISVAPDGSQPIGWSTLPAISGDGRFVAFLSRASNLVPSDTNSAADVFVHDRQTGETTRVSVASDGAAANNTEDEPKLFERLSISPDGRFVAFESTASNLVPGDTNNRMDVFVHDRHTGETSRVSVDSSGVQGFDGSDSPSISADGRYVVFRSFAPNFSEPYTTNPGIVLVHDRQTGRTRTVSVDSHGNPASGGSPGSAAISGDGRIIGMEQPDGPYRRIAVHDLNGVPVAPPTGSLTILLDAIPEDDTGFTFSGTNGLGRFVLQDSSSNSRSFPNLPARSDGVDGIYEVMEVVPSGWTLTAISCTGGSSNAVSNGVRITLEVGEDITCTFENLKQVGRSWLQYLPVTIR